MKGRHARNDEMLRVVDYIRLHPSCPKRHILVGAALEEEAWRHCMDRLVFLGLVRHLYYRTGWASPLQEKQFWTHTFTPTCTKKAVESYVAIGGKVEDLPEYVRKHATRCQS